MPSNIIFNIDKDTFTQLLAKQESNENNASENNSITLNLTIEMQFLSESELESLKTFVKENKKLEYLKINLPGSFSFEELLTEELIKEQVPNLKITIQEKIDNVTTTTFNEFS